MLAKFDQLKFWICLLIAILTVGLGTIRWGMDTYYVYPLLYGKDVYWAENFEMQLETVLCEGNIPSSSWSKKDPDRLGHWWLRAQIDLPEEHAIRDWGLSVSLTGSREVYWDGILLGVSGRLGIDKASEVEGVFHRIHTIPRELATPGLHSLHFHISNYHLQNYELQPNVILAGERDHLTRNPLRLSALVCVLAGMFLFTGGYFLVLFIVSERRISFLLFGLLGLALCGLAIMEYIKYGFDFSYSFHYLRLQTIGLLTNLVALILPMFCAFHFQLSRKWLMVTGLLTGLLIIRLQNGYDQAAFYAVITGVLAAMALTLFALFQRKKGSGEVLIGISACFLMVLAYDLTLFLGFALLMATMMVSLARTQGESRRAHEIAQLRGSRLEIELLKKQLQPHFLKNTLGSLVAWVEDQPNQAVAFIEALAEELEVLIEVSGATLIPLDREVELCHAHLAVMAFRTEMRYGFELDLEKRPPVPPAIFHTLLENGLTHMAPVGNRLDFALSSRRQNRGTQFCFNVYGECRKPNMTGGEGTGLRYIKARMQEAYGDHWSLHHGQADGAWLTTITITKEVDFDPRINRGR